MISAAAAVPEETTVISEADTPIKPSIAGICLVLDMRVHRFLIVKGSMKTGRRQIGAASSFSRLVNWTEEPELLIT